MTGLLGSALVVAWRQPAGTIYTQVIHFSLSPLFMAMMLPLAAGISTGRGALAGLIAFTSRISYSLYLINFSLVAEVIRDQCLPHGGVDGVLKYLAFWMIVYAGATALYYSFEKPVMELRDR